MVRGRRQNDATEPRYQQLSDGCRVKGRKGGRVIILRIPTCLKCPLASGCRYDDGRIGEKARSELREWAMAQGVQPEIEHQRIHNAREFKIQAAAWWIEGATSREIALVANVGERTAYRSVSEGRKIIETELGEL